MKQLLVFAISLLPVMAGSQPPPPLVEARDVSLIHLIANPEQHEGKMVRLVGVAHFEFEEAALYLHREDEAVMNSQNAIWIGGKAGYTQADYKALSGAFVIVEGRFTGKAHGHLGAYPGELRTYDAWKRSGSEPTTNAC
jgi:hypothetical protein